MSGLQITITTAGYAALVNAQNLGTNPTLVAQIGITEQAFIANAGMTTLPGELKRLTTFAGSAVADDTVHVTIRDDGPDTYSMRGFGLYLADGTLLAIYGQVETILEKSAQAMMLLAADIRFVDINATELVFGDTNWINPPATTEVQGVLELATLIETITGDDDRRGVTPAGVKATLDSRFGVGAPSAFIKGLLSLATAALMRLALGLGSAATRDEGANNGLDADKLDGQHGDYYLSWGNQKGLPSAFPPASHGHVWGDIGGAPATATRWPTWLEVGEKPSAFPPAAHTHAWGAITSGVPATATRWPAVAEVAGLPAALSEKVSRASPAFDSGYWRMYTYGGASGSSIHDDGGSYMQSFFTASTPVRHLAISCRDAAGNSSPIDIRLAGDFIANGNPCYHAGNFGLIPHVPQPGYLALRGVAAPVGTGVTFSNTGTQVIASATALVRLSVGAGQLDVGPAGVTIAGTLNPTGGYDYGSSVKLKDVHGPMPYGLAEVRRISTLIGRYKPEYNDDGRVRLFFDADQFAGVMPEVVDIESIEFNGERVAAMKLDQVMPPAYRAIAELADLVDALVREVAALKAAG